MSAKQKYNDLDFDFLKPTSVKIKNNNKYFFTFIITAIITAFLLSLSFNSNHSLSDNNISTSNKIISIDNQTNIFLNYFFESEFQFNLLNLNQSININNPVLFLENQNSLFSELASNPLLISMLNKETNGLHNNVTVKNSIYSKHIKFLKVEPDKSTSVIVEVKTKQNFKFLDSSLMTQKTFNVKLYFDKYNNYSNFELLN